MEKKNILNISLILSLLGILLLVFISENSSAKLVSISSITQGHIDKDVTIIGKVSSINKHGDINFLKVKDGTGKIDVVVFKSNNLVLKSGNKVEVYGKVAIYDGKLEIIAKSIRLV